MYRISSLSSFSHSTLSLLPLKKGNPFISYLSKVHSNASFSLLKLITTFNKHSKLQSNFGAVLIHSNVNVNQTKKFYSTSSSSSSSSSSSQINTHSSMIDNTITNTPISCNSTSSNSHDSLEIVLKEGLEKLGLPTDDLEAISLEDLELKAKVLSYLMQHAQVQFTSLGISAIHTAKDIITYQHLNHMEPVALFPIADWFKKQTSEKAFPPNVKFIPYDHKNRKRNRQLY